MRFLAMARHERLTRTVHAAMVDNLFGTLVGFAALGVASVLLAVLTFAKKPGVMAAAMLATMTTVAVARAILMVSYHRWRRNGGHLRSCVDWEINYAILGIAMMACIGAICGYDVITGESEMALIVSIIVVMGISGCIAGRNGSRPSIVRLQLCAVTAPFVVALAIRGSSETMMVLVLILLFDLATMSSTRSIHATLRSTLVTEGRNRRLSQRIESEARLFDVALNNMTSGLLLFDVRHRLVVANEKVKDLFGRSLVEESIGRDASEFRRRLLVSFASEGHDAALLASELEMFMKMGGGTLSVVDRRRCRVFSLRLVVMASGAVVVNVDDITEQRVKDGEIYRLAHHDSLTGLPNRAALTHCLEKRLANVDREGLIVVMYLDLDHFKDVNDGLGHAAGDAVLVEIARRLAAGIGDGDFLARISGDEFVFVFAEVRDASLIGDLASRLISAVSVPCDVGQRQIFIGASAGLCVAGSGEGAAEEALRTADVALYDAKLHGRGLAHWFAPAMDDRLRVNRELVADLRDALETGRGLAMHYQPVFDARTGRVIACEALMRWTHESIGPIPPSRFITLAEESGLIATLGRWGLLRACEDAVSWPDPTMKVAVNASGLQFRQGAFAAIVRDALRRTGLAAERLEIEITESVLADDVGIMASELAALAAMGVSVALDDFGTGFSSLSLLHKLPVDKVKLDRSFVARLDADPSAVALIASIVQMGQVLRKIVVIEGVETASQLALITGVQARFVQGFHFSRPLPQRELIALLDERFETGPREMASV